MIEFKDEFLELAQWIFPYQIENKFILFSHAGVSNTWYENVKKATGISCIADINTLEPSELFGFIPDIPWDDTGQSKTQPCVWIRPGTLITDMPEGIIQVVGHTPAVRCINLTKEFRDRKVEGSKGYQKFLSVPDLWLCDTLGIGEYLVIDNGEFIIKKLTSNESTL